MPGKALVLYSGGNGLSFAVSQCELASVLGGLIKKLDCREFACCQPARRLF